MSQVDNIFCSFKIDSLEVCLNVSAVQEVVNYPSHIIKMPLSPDFLEGVFNLRNMIIPIINLRSLLKLEKSDTIETHKVGIIDYQGARVGLIFDTTSEIIRLSHTELSQLTYSDDSEHVIKGVLRLSEGERVIQLINPKALFKIENIPQILSSQKNHLEKESVKAYLRKKCITFTVSKVKMAFNISEIYEVINLKEVKKSALYHELCSGHIVLRGQTVSIINFKKLLKLDFTEDCFDSKIIVLKTENGLFGFKVDSVDSINSYEDENIMPIPLVNKERKEMFVGAIPLTQTEDVILLSGKNLLSHSEVKELCMEHKVNYKVTEEVSTKTFDRESYVSFKSKNLFGVSIKDISEIIHFSDDILEAPNMPSFVKGVLNLRGKLVTIIDMRSYYNMPEYDGDAKKTKILIFEREGEKFGLIVDEVESIITINSENKLKLPSLMLRELKEEFEDDIKEVISLENEGEDKKALIVLNIGAVRNRLDSKMAA